MHGTADTFSPPGGTQPRLISVQHAADAIGITRRELYRRIKAGDLETVRLGRRRLVPVDALDGYVARLREEARIGRVAS